MTLATSLTVAAGDVISQSPAAGAETAPNTAVNLTVSVGVSAGGGALYKRLGIQRTLRLGF